LAAVLGGGVEMSLMISNTEKILAFEKLPTIKFFQKRLSIHVGRPVFTNVQ